MASQQQLSFAIKAVNDAKKALNDAERDVLNLGKAADESEKKSGGLGKALGGIPIPAVAAGAAIGGATAFMFSAVKAAIEDEAATKRLEQALRNSSGAYDENLAKVNAAIEAGAKKAFTDDQVRDSFQQLLAATGDTNEALSRQALAMDLSRGAGISLEQASKMVGRVTEENVEAFKKMGITIGEGASEAEALAVIQQKFGGQADAYAKSTAGQMESAKIQLGEVKEQIGTALLPVVAKLATVFANDVVPAIQSFVNVAGPKVKEFAADVKRYWESDIKPALDALKKAWEDLEPVILPLLKIIADDVERMVKSVALALGIIVDLLGGDFSGAWTKAKELVDVQVEFIQKTAGNLVTFVTNLAPLMLEAGKAVGSAMLDGLKDGLTGTVGFVQDVGAEILKALKAMVNVAIIDPINRALEFHVGGSILGKDWGVNINPPDIPHLAAGGIVNRPTLALIGEAGPEAVVPLSGPNARGFGASITIVAIDARISHAPPVCEP